ncbi:hypothetical protein BKA67DRAFT_658639 [Truncatella angustata]|uniref:RRM domain-containing protein n=1 Tax=Truncatella angustata TaxID=152316 RepID=A0A9P8ZYT1_9PEZI|nr:uncharacterized protein BKA67DRAFT_658639 [Truncatella angustata]KAH6654335.1 hypothetical protein BKA67DRAFT_658639 [Truncatella angustata]
MGKIASDFNKIINEGRERKKNEALAAKIFGTKDNRRSSTPGRAAAGGSLASRVGVKKRQSTSSAPRIPPGDINAGWAHDLHGTRSTPNLRAQNNQQAAPRAGSLAARIHAPGARPAAARAIPTGPRAGGRAVRLASAVSRTSGAQMNITQAPPTQPRGITIRGLAGPFAIRAQNFAPGTTAADIESAMTPIGGIVQSCRLLKSQPIVIAEVVFESKEGADRVIETFNNQTADGRLLYVYHKPADGSHVPAAPAPRVRANETRSAGNVVVDGTNGFDELVDSDQGYNSNVSNGGGLYSDSLMNRGGNGNRRGRGFQNNRGRGGR